MIPALTAIRGVAAWWVVLYHFREALPLWMPAFVPALAGQGYLAVDLFFQLSGFVLALNYFGRFQTLTRAGAVDFLVRRLARIYPLHVVMLVLTLTTPVAILLLSSHGDVGDRFGLAYFVMSLFLIQNWGFSSGLDWNVPAWSISAEWFAYILFPVLAWSAGRYVREAWRGAALAAVLFLVLGSVAFLTDSGLEGSIHEFGLLRCVLQFTAGTMLWRIVSCHPAEGWKTLLAALVFILCFVAYALWSVPNYVAAPVGFFALIYMLTDPLGWPSRLLCCSALEWAGVVSYSTYLSHYLIKEWVKFALVRPGIPAGVPILAYLTVVMAASGWLHAWVEEPARRLLLACWNRARGRGLETAFLTVRQPSERSSG